MTKDKVQKILTSHKLWLSKDVTGMRADFSEADLSRADLSRVNLSGADLSGANLSKADLSKANLFMANLFGANLSMAYLFKANLSKANLFMANLFGANLSMAYLFKADLSRVNLSRADLSGADLFGADLFEANLSGVQGLLNPVDWIKRLEATPEGLICYKSFGSNYPVPDSWKLVVGAVLEEVVNPLLTLDCACGINVATKDWPDLPETGVWKCLIRWPWLVGVVVPYNTTGKFRTAKVELIEQVI